MTVNPPSTTQVQQTTAFLTPEQAQKQKDSEGKIFISTSTILTPGGIYEGITFVLTGNDITLTGSFENPPLIIPPVGRYGVEVKNTKNFKIKNINIKTKTKENEVTWYSFIYDKIKEGERSYGGLLLENSQHGVIEGITIVANDNTTNGVSHHAGAIGISLINVSDVTLSENHLNGNIFGVLIAGSENLALLDNEIINNQRSGFFPKSFTDSSPDLNQPCDSCDSAAIVIAHLEENPARKTNNIFIGTPNAIHGNNISGGNGIFVVRSDKIGSAANGVYVFNNLISSAHNAIEAVEGQNLIIGPNTYRLTEQTSHALWLSGAQATIVPGYINNIFDNRTDKTKPLSVDQYLKRSDYISGEDKNLPDRTTVGILPVEEISSALPNSAKQYLGQLNQNQTNSRPTPQSKTTTLYSIGLFSLDYWKEEIRIIRQFTDPLWNWLKNIFAGELGGAVINYDQQTKPIVDLASTVLNNSPNGSINLPNLLRTNSQGSLIDTVFQIPQQILAEFRNQFPNYSFELDNGILYFAHRDSSIKLRDIPRSENVKKTIARTAVNKLLPHVYFDELPMFDLRSYLFELATFSSHLVQQFINDYVTHYPNYYFTASIPYSGNQPLFNQTFFVDSFNLFYGDLKNVDDLEVKTVIEGETLGKIKEDLKKKNLQFGPFIIGNKTEPITFTAVVLNQAKQPVAFVFWRENANFNTPQPSAKEENTLEPQPIVNYSMFAPFPKSVAKPKSTPTPFAPPTLSPNSTKPSRLANLFGLILIPTLECLTTKDSLVQNFLPCKILRKIVYTPGQVINIAQTKIKSVFEREIIEHKVEIIKKEKVKSASGTTVEKITITIDGKEHTLYLANISPAYRAKITQATPPYHRGNVVEKLNDCQNFCLVLPLGYLNDQTISNPEFLYPTKTNDGRFVSPNHLIKDRFVGKNSEINLASGGLYIDKNGKIQLVNKDDLNSAMNSNVGFAQMVYYLNQNNKDQILQEHWEHFGTETVIGNTEYMWSAYLQNDKTTSFMTTSMDDNIPLSAFVEVANLMNKGDFEMVLTDSGYGGGLFYKENDESETFGTSLDDMYHPAPAVMVVR